ncbi:MAG TPA: hypothetical protein GYA07_04610 [Verrucomicrobia bacterium]|nr:hypothetical protein [Verrucomicrobiota bacterium]HOP97695.1 hypothetical protein [Verrucomicrobiota bacterium]
MDIAALQHELEGLPSEQQDRAAAFLAALRRIFGLSAICSFTIGTYGNQQGRKP